MTTWTNISNGSLAVGAIPSSSIATALRDNPAAAMETAAGAPVNYSDWHPHDKIISGDSNSGLIYSFAISGVVSTVVTPDFADGWEYRLVCFNISHNNGSNAGFQVEYYQDTAALWDVAGSWSGVNPGLPVHAIVDIANPRVSSARHIGQLNVANNGGQDIKTLNSGGSGKIGKVRLSWGAGSFDSGTVYMLRRRDWLSVP